jgi:phosphoglycolate phosphatase
MILKKYKHVIWDWNGTLFNDAELCHSIINGLLKRNKIEEISLLKYKEIFGFPIEDYYKKAGLDFNIIPFEILGKEFMDEYENRKFESTVFTEALQILEIIYTSGITQSILSAYHQDSLNEIINYFGIRNYFNGLIGLDNIYASSKVEQGRRWMKELGHKRGEVVLIGDTLHDFEVSDEIGADCILVSSGHQSKKRLLKCGVPVFEDLNLLKLEILNHN